MNYREKIRKAIECPQFGDTNYGEWGALRLDQRVLIKRLLDELDSADAYITNLEMKRYKAIDYIKENKEKLDITNDFKGSGFDDLLDILDWKEEWKGEH